MIDEAKAKLEMASPASISFAGIVAIAAGGANGSSSDDVEGWDDIFTMKNWEFHSNVSQFVYTRHGIRL